VLPRRRIISGHVVYTGFESFKLVPSQRDRLKAVSSTNSESNFWDWIGEDVITVKLLAYM
jgi:hypothetical protein